MWLDTTSASSPTIKFFDGTDDISFATIDYSANTVNFLDSTVVADVSGDSTPQLGGDLDVNGNDIVSTSNADANGHGLFEYAVPTGFYALCTKNLAEFG